MKGLSHQYTTHVYTSFHNLNWILLSKRMDFRWVSRVFDDDFNKVNKLQSSEVTRHPLEKNVIVVTNRNSSTPNVTGNKPMTTTTSWGGFDPLSDPLASLKVDDSHSEVEDEVVLKWPTFRAKVLSKFKTEQRIAIKSSFLSIAKSSNSSGLPASTSSLSVADQVRQRLQTIDEGSNSTTSGEMINLTQEEFTSKMNQMNELLLESWNTDQRVKSLKIVIQITKMLTEIPSVSFYPSQFMLIVDILDSFGSLVSSRITNKVNESMNSNTQDVAIETAKNWFYKVSSIRELIPRFFIEISILKIYKFVFSPNQIIENLLRLSMSVNGISNAIVSIYATCYLVKTVTDLAMNDPTRYPQHSIQRVIEKNIKSISSLSTQLEDSSIDLKKNHSVLSPALDWIINSFKTMKGDETFLLHQLGSFNKSLSCIFLKSILDNCSNSLIESTHHQILHSILDADGPDSESITSSPVSELIISFGKRVSSIKSLSRSDPSIKRKVISDIWKKMATLPLLDYLTCTSAWIEFVVVNLTREESRIVLNDLVKRTTSTSIGNDGKSLKQVDVALLSIVKTVAKSASSIQLITHSTLPLLNVINKSEHKVEACKLLIQSVIGGDGNPLGMDASHDNGQGFDQRQDQGFDQRQDQSLDQRLDHETLKSLYSLSRLLANSVDFMTIEDEKRNISSLIISCLRVILSTWTGEEGVREEELESQLDLLMEARSDFVDLELVTGFLVHASNSLTAQCFVQGKKGMNRYLIQSSLAYSYITIPSLSDHHVQLQLFLNSAQVSLLTTSLSQTDSFLKSAITLLNSLPPGYETNDGRMVSFDNFFVDYSTSLLSFLILVPDHPDHDIIYLAKALHTVVASRDITDPGLRTLILLKFIAYISWTRQTKLPFHVPGVDSNDKLYSGDEVFVTALNTFGSEILNEILNHLATVKNEQRKKQLVKQVLDWIQVYGDTVELSKLCQKLAKLCK